jgi:aspartate/methionine/tyrosine aminotransferase
MIVSERLRSLPQSATVELADKIRRLSAEGKQIIALQTGDPDFQTPRPIVEAACRAMREGFTHYVDSHGLHELREAIARKLKNFNRVEYDPASEILVTHGGVHAYYSALQAILNPGDEVLIPDPIWMTHVNVASMLGATVKRVPSRPEDGFWPRTSDWESAVSPKTVALVINSPSNPTGSVASEKYLTALVQFASRRNLYVISDEVYESILFDKRKHVSVASLPDAQERTVLVNSFSKTYAMTGWRIGYLAAPSPIVDQAIKASQNSITNVAPFVQKAALCALTSPDVAEASLEMARQYEHRRNLALSVLDDAPKRITAVRPQGAFYLFVDIRSLGQLSVTLAEHLLIEKLVSMAPGSVFGMCGEGFLRMTLAASEHDIETGLMRLIDFAENRC